MSTLMNEGVNMNCKTVTTNFFTVVVLLVELSTDITKPRVYLDEYYSIYQPSIIVTSNSTDISSYLFIYYFFISILQTNSIYQHNRG